MQEVSSTLLRLWKIFWAYSWRYAIYSIIVGFVFALILGIFIGFSSVFNIITYLFPEGQVTLKHHAFTELIEQIAFTPLAAIAFMRVMKLKFKDFTLALLPQDKTDTPLSQTPGWKMKRTLCFWFVWWALSVLVYLPLSLLFFNYLEGVYLDLAEMLLVVIADLLILKLLLRFPFTNFRLALISHEENSQKS